MICQREIPLRRGRGRGRPGALLLPERGPGPRPAAARGRICWWSTATSTRSSAPGRDWWRLTLGPEGAVLLEGGREVARASPPRVEAVDGTAAGDAFCAALVVSLLEGRERGEALRRACAAGALAASRIGAQPSLPSASELEAVLGAVSADHPRLRPRPRRRDRADAGAREPRGASSSASPRWPATRRSRRRPPTRSGCSTTSVATRSGRRRGAATARARAPCGRPTSTARAVSTARTCTRRPARRSRSTRSTGSRGRCVRRRSR